MRVSALRWKAPVCVIVCGIATTCSGELHLPPGASAPQAYLITAAPRLEGPRSKTNLITALPEGSVTPTKHPLVAQYALLAPPGSTVQIQFGTDENYGRETSEQKAPPGGGEVDILVAGMRANTLYHMRAQVTLADGRLIFDSDHTFTTGDIPSGRLPTITAETVPEQVPQPGVELIDATLPVVPNGIDAIVADLDGNVIWYYDPGLPLKAPGLDPVKLLPNGHFLLNYREASNLDGENSILQEVDLAGNVIWQMTANDLNKALGAATCVGCNVTVVGTHHDFAVLPNGHLVVLAAMSKFVPNVAGYPSGINVLGDVVIDLDQNRNPVWLWSAFDHLDVNRHPIGFPDWTHSNTVVYSPADRSLIVSMRHQSWVIKIDYNDGKGSGDVLWRLGYQGDFTLVDGISPIDWQYAQHDFNVIRPADEDSRDRHHGQRPENRKEHDDAFDALLFDNGNSRVLDANGDVCGGSTNCYSRVVIFHLDEDSKTVTLEWVDTLPLFSTFAGSARRLENGNIEFDECGLPGPVRHSAIFEVTQTPAPVTVWQMQVTGWFVYRGFRIPSLYPGVQW
ncbi:MAG TPA: aryl-sulfate sulfotransferase [Candidatus Acidoferrum sp.]